MDECQNLCLFSPHLPAGHNHQQHARGYAADLLDVAPELSALCLALLAELFGVFGLVAAALLAFVPELLGHKRSFLHFAIRSSIILARDPYGLVRCSDAAGLPPWVW